MKTETLERRLNNLKVTTRVKDVVIKVIVSRGDKIYYSNYVGSGRYRRKIVVDPREALKEMKISFIEGNNAPRGGQGGLYVSLTPYGIKQCSSYCEHHHKAISEKKELERQKEQERIDKYNFNVNQGFDTCVKAIDEQFIEDVKKMHTLKGLEKDAFVKEKFPNFLKRNKLFINQPFYKVFQLLVRHIRTQF